MVRAEPKPCTTWAVPTSSTAHTIPRRPCSTKRRGKRSAAAST
jgi:hypothetical protein